jgi:hypothetical protein
MESHHRPLGPGPSALATELHPVMRASAREKEAVPSGWASPSGSIATRRPATSGRSGSYGNRTRLTRETIALRRQSHHEPRNQKVRTSGGRRVAGPSSGPAASESGNQCPSARECHREDSNLSLRASQPRVPSLERWHHLVAVEGIEPNVRPRLTNGPARI